MPNLQSSSSFNVTTSLCVDLKIIDARPHHPCYNWNHSLIQCEIDWPCEVRQFLVTISPLIRMTSGLLSYGTLVIILLGLFLNLLSLYTLISSGLSKSGSGIYLVSLAICDCGNLVANYAVGIARAHVPAVNDLFMESEWLCRWHGVFVELFQLISAWIVVSFSVERCLAIWYPLLLRSSSRTGRAKKAIITLGSLLTLLSLSKLVLTGFEKDSVFGYAACYSQRYRWRGAAYVWVAFQTWLPTLLVFTFNLLMFCKLKQMKRVRKRLTEVKRPAAGATGRQGSFISRPSPTAPMLVAVSLAYLVLVFPVGVVQTVELVWNVRNHQPVYTLGDVDGVQRFIEWKNTKLLLKYVRSFCFGFYQINFCINFFLYFAAGLQFRVHLQKKVKELFGGRCCSCGGNGGAPEAATPGTSSTALDSRRGSQRQPPQHHVHWQASGRNQNGGALASPPAQPPSSPGGGQVMVAQVHVIRYEEEIMEPVEDLDYQEEIERGDEGEEEYHGAISMAPLNPFSSSQSPRQSPQPQQQQQEEDVEENMGDLPV